MKKIAYPVILLLCSYYGFSQVSIGTTAPDASSILYIESSNKGFLLPIVRLNNISDVSTINTIESFNSLIK
ncbi:hypothetical protein GCM10023311_08650 [Flaviramulus aquimarinus]|uniref:Uncharacterized protein n=1 Tax=Flaviramulus aquimarinus TaxID=1170456 RepID=A0ABP9EV33_9FLAO